MSDMNRQAIESNQRNKLGDSRCSFWETQQPFFRDYSMQMSEPLPVMQHMLMAIRSSPFRS